MPNPTPSLFSAKLPTLQLAWDATSLRAMTFCPRFYDLTIRQGWRRDAIDLEFGIFAHKAMEEYDRALWAGKAWEEAQLAAVTYALTATGSYLPLYDEYSQEQIGQEWVPWGGQYVTAWKCAGKVAYMKGLSKGKKKCPNAYARVWLPGSAPHSCPECGGPTVEAERWLPAKVGKDRPALIRTVIWWCEELRGSSIRTLTLPDGKPAVEVNFQVALPFYFSPSDGLSAAAGEEPEQFYLCGYWDGAVEVGQERFVKERKTTKSALGPQYWSGFAPNMQTDTYDLVVKFLPEVKDWGIRGVLVEAAQTLDSGSRFGHHILYRTEDQRQEHLESVREILADAVRFAKDGHWPMRKAQCPMCPMKAICSKERGKREMFLKADYKQFRWNPLEERA